MKLKEIMTPDPDVLSPSTILKAAARKMRDLDIGIIPVCEGGRVQGMLSDRDITIRATAEGLDPCNVEVENVMTPDVVFCFEDQDVKEAAELMKHEQLRRLVVQNRDKRLTGIVSLGDVAVKYKGSVLCAETLDHVSRPASPAR